MISGDGASRVDILFAVQQLPEPLRTAAGERMLDADRAAIANDFLRCKRSRDTTPTIVLRPVALEGFDGLLAQAVAGVGVEHVMAICVFHQTVPPIEKREKAGQT